MCDQNWNSVNKKRERIGNCVCEFFYFAKKKKVTEGINFDEDYKRPCRANEDDVGTGGLAVCAAGRQQLIACGGPHSKARPQLMGLPEIPGN